jgi:hypothetical protein
MAEKACHTPADNLDTLDIVPTSRIQDLLAIDVFRCAEETGQPATLGLVESRLAELAAHEPACKCGLCAPASIVKPLYWIASRWQNSITATRRRGAR